MYKGKAWILLNLKCIARRKIFKCLSLTIIHPMCSSVILRLLEAFIEEHHKTTFSETEKNHETNQILTKAEHSKMTLKFKIIIEEAACNLSLLLLQ